MKGGCIYQIRNKKDQDEYKHSLSRVHLNSRRFPQVKPPRTRLAETHIDATYCSLIQKLVGGVWLLSSVCGLSAERTIGLLQKSYMSCGLSLIFLGSTYISTKSKSVFPNVTSKSGSTGLYGCIMLVSASTKKRRMPSTPPSRSRIRPPNMCADYTTLHENQ